MTLPRRTFFRLAAGAAAFPASLGFRIFAPGLGTDRSIAAGAHRGRVRPRQLGGHRCATGSPDRCRSGLVSEFIVDNQSGIGGNIATEAVVNAAPNGRTLLMVGPSSAIDATLYERLGFDFRRDIAPVAALVRSPNVMAAGPCACSKDRSRIHRAGEGQSRQAYDGLGGGRHGEPPRGRTVPDADRYHAWITSSIAAAPAPMPTLLDGRVDVYFPPLISATRATSGAACCGPWQARPRLVAKPTTWFGIGAPRNTPADIVERLNAEINAALADSKLAARLADVGGTVVAGSAADFGKLIADETARWAKVIKFSGTTLS